VSVANTRGPESLKDLAAETGATPATVEDAAAAKDVVIISIPENAVPHLPLDALKKTSAVIIDTGNYYPARDGQMAEIDSGLTESGWVSQVIGRPVVKAFNNIAAHSLLTRGVPAGTAGRIALPIAGDDPGAKKTAMDLIEELGFDAVDAGTLADSWRQQPGTPVYAQDLDKPGVEAALMRAESDKVASYRAAADEAARAWFQS
jgi:predicted dinucleotide-binding enzyme